MVVRRTVPGTGSGWVKWGLWIAGAALLLMALNAGTEYLDAGLRQNMGNLLGWAPAMGMMTLKVAEQSIWHWETLAPVVRGVPLATLGVVFVAVGLALHKDTTN